MSEVLHLILRMMLEQWKTMDEELIVYRLKQTAEMAEELERERDEARERAERYRLEANAIMMQRDEAREERLCRR